MNKKFKIITTFASLVLALALMTFGVYSATSSSFSITSHVSFVSNHVKMQYEGTVVGGTFVSGSAGVGVLEAEARTKTTPVAGSATDPESKIIWDMGEYTFNTDGTGEIVYTFKVTSLGSEDVKITLTDLTLPSTNITATVKEGASNITEGKVWNPISQNSFCQIVITLTVTDVAQSIIASAGVISVKFDVEQST